jgi:hypothetical protein
MKAFHRRRQQLAVTSILAACASKDACVTDAIYRQAAAPRSNLPDAQRLKALKYVVHFVADVHQPSHAGYADDRGENGYQIMAWDGQELARWGG